MPARQRTPGFAPRVVLVELLLAEQRVRAGERHRHVEVRDARVARGVEDRRVEARVARVEDRRRADRLGQRDDVRRIRRVDRRRLEAVVEPGDRALGAREIDVGEHHPLEEVAARRDRCRCTADAAGSDDEDAHQRVCGKPRSTFEVAGSGQRDVTTFVRV